MSGGTKQTKTPSWPLLLIPIGILALAGLIVFADLTKIVGPDKSFEEGLEAFNQGKHIEAIRKLSKANRDREGDIEARFLLGASYHNYGWHDEALKQYEDVWRICVNKIELAMRNAARIYEQRGEIDLATTSIRRALAVNPEAADLWFQLGNLLIRQKKIPEALAAVRNACRLAPQNQDYKRAYQNLTAIMSVK